MEPSIRITCRLMQKELIRLIDLRETWNLRRDEADFSSIVCYSFFSHISVFTCLFLYLSTRPSWKTTPCGLRAAGLNIVLCMCVYVCRAVRTLYNCHALLFLCTRYIWRNFYWRLTTFEKWKKKGIITKGRDMLFYTTLNKYNYWRP